MLSITDIRYSIEGRPLFEGASANIPEGHKVGLVGRNGTGKTTLFKLTYGVYDGRTFKMDRFAAYLAANDIPWPRLDTGRLALDDDTFRNMARSYPQVSALRELRHALGELRLNSLAVAIVDAKRALTFRVVQLRQPPQMRAQIPTLFTGWPDPLPVRKCTQVRSPSRLSLWVEMKPRGSMTRARFSQWSGSR